MPTSLAEGEARILLGDKKFEIPGKSVVNPPINAVTESTLSVGDPDRGLSVVSYKKTNAKGVVTEEAHYATPLLLLPLPVAPGIAWDSVATDSKSLQSARVQGRVSKTAETDACGSVVAGWQTESTYTTASATANTTSNMVMNVATQLGGLPILVREGALSAPTFLEYSLAAPLPKPGAG